MFKNCSGFLEKFNILYEKQLGFRSNHSAVDAVASVFETIRRAKMKGNNWTAVFLDLQKLLTP